MAKSYLPDRTAKLTSDYVCNMPLGLITAYQSIIDTYKPERLDFDIEGGFQTQTGPQVRGEALLLLAHLGFVNE